MTIENGPNNGIVNLIVSVNLNPIGLKEMLKPLLADTSERFFH